MDAHRYSDDDNDENENPHTDYRKNTYDDTSHSRGNNISHSRGNNISHIRDNNISHSRDNNTGGGDGDQHRYLSNLARGRTINFYINGNPFFPSKRLVYNPKEFRDISNYMDHLTEKLGPRFGAVRKICTPRHGSRVLHLADLQEDGAYVVVGNEHFKPYRYDQISARDRRKSPPFNYSADPVYHNRQFLSSGKIKKIDTHSLLIKVWPNGGDLKGPRRVLVTPRIRPYTLSTVISHVNEMLKEDCLGAVEKLYFLTGSQVSDVDQIVQNGQYVACRKGDKFKRARYNEQAVKNMATSPRLDRKLLAPLFPRSVNSTSQSSPEHWSPSTQNSLTSYPPRRKGADRDKGRTFPVNNTRGSDKGLPNGTSERGYTNGLDTDHGGVFKSKDRSRNIRPAKEAVDSRYTKGDYSAEHWDDQDFDEEPILSKDAKKLGKKLQDNSRGHFARQDASSTQPQKSERQSRKPSIDRKLEEEKAAAKIQAGYRGYETRKQQSSPPNKTDQNHNVGSRNNNMEPYQDPRNKKPTVSNGKRQNVEKQPTSSLQTGNRDFNPRKPPHLNYDDTEEEAVIKIQAGVRGYQTRKHISEQKAAATKIQSCFRGYQERKHLASAPTRPSRDGKTRQGSQDGAAGPVKATGNRHGSRQQAMAREDSYDELDRENNAALTIQSHYRGYLTRKDIAAKGVSPPNQKARR